MNPLDESVLLARQERMDDKGITLPHWPSQSAAPCTLVITCDLRLNP
jgi:hypothetical protein